MFSRISLFVIVLAGLVAVPSEATAIVSVKESVWQADFAYYHDPLTGAQITSMPAGVTLACTGTAYADGFGGCMDKHGASVKSSNGDLVTKIVNVLGGLQLQNTSSVDYAGSFVFNVKFSSFNPAGPNVGISVDNAGAQYAAFYSIVSGPGAYDFKGCTLSYGPGSGGGTCGIPFLGFNWGQAVLGPLTTGSTAAADYLIHINVAARGPDPVPETPTIAMLVAALGLLTFKRHGVRRAA